MAELPPRARRILAFLINAFLQYGTTSACAENTLVSSGISSVMGNYLRVRGEYPIITIPGLDRKELPPRARRIHLTMVDTINRDGTTSACAENTRGCSHGTPSCWNYLRVRGEY